MGVWNTGGLHLRLRGDANDYVGKGMAGGKIIITPSEEGRFERQRAPIVGNTCLYGATGGILYAAGSAGERFAVRNSGAITVVEGVGDHGCEYMTGGEVVILGSTGLNFGAGMSGGCAFVYDRKGRFSDRINSEMISLERLTGGETSHYRERLETHIKNYCAETQSEIARFILDNFDSELNYFWLVKPSNIELSKLWEMIQTKAA